MTEQEIFSEERCKELMQQVGLPESNSLKNALNQVANEVEQRVEAIYRTRVLEVVDACFCAYASYYREDAKEMANKMISR